MILEFVRLRDEIKQIVIVKKSDFVSIFWKEKYLYNPESWTHKIVTRYPNTKCNVRTQECLLVMGTRQNGSN